MAASLAFAGVFVEERGHYERSKTRPAFSLSGASSAGGWPMIVVARGNLLAVAAAGVPGRLFGMAGFVEARLPSERRSGKRHARPGAC
jgi:hypothetical protein